MAHDASIPDEVIKALELEGNEPLYPNGCPTISPDKILKCFMAIGRNAQPAVCFDMRTGKNYVPAMRRRWLKKQIKKARAGKIVHHRIVNIPI